MQLPVYYRSVNVCTVCESAQFSNALYNVQKNLLCNLARVMIMVRLGLRSGMGLGLGSNLGTYICKLRMHNLEIGQVILQIVQIDKSCVT